MVFTGIRKYRIGYLHVRVNISCTDCSIKQLHVNIVYVLFHIWISLVDLYLHEAPDMFIL